MKKFIFIISFLVLFCLFAELGMSQANLGSGAQFRRTAVHNGNQVKTVFGNWGVIGQPCNGGPRGAWRYDNDGYIGDVTPLVGAEVRWNQMPFHSVATCPVARPTTLRDTDPAGLKYWTFEPVGGYFNANKDKVAMSTDRNSWPAFWPDKLQDPNDPGWRGSWNGYFGKRINADQESYFVMDDNNDERFNFANNNPRRIAFKPDSLNLLRNGLGLEVRVRGMQWAQFLAKDNIFWLYEIKNTGTTNYDKAVFGMLVGTYVGVTGCDDNPHEYDDDWSFYNAKANITFTGDYFRNNSRNPLWVGPVGMVGYAFLESPGNPYDGIDNDGDADTVSEASTAPFFTASSFDSTIIGSGPGMRNKVVLIDTNYQRSVYTISQSDTIITLHTRGLVIHFDPRLGLKVAEGNVLTKYDSVYHYYTTYVNPNSYDGVDNDFDGLIDENYFVHYRQLKKSPTNIVLIDQLRPVRHIDYLAGAGTSPYSMIDERRNDLIDNNRNWDIRYDDVGRDGIPSTHDYGEGDGSPTSGYDNNYHDSGLPGEPHIDKTDVGESDQIGLTSFYYFTPAGVIVMADKEGLWKNLEPGFFDVPVSINYDPILGTSKPLYGQDGDFMYGSGYFPLRAGTTERFSLALVYGGGKGGSRQDDIDDLLKNKKTVQKIYDANYQFPQPPDVPTLVAVPGDKQVTLYWDRKAESSIDPVLRIKDFEGYKIYRSTDPTFNDIFTITDASGTAQGYRPLAQFDLQDGITGYFRAPAELYNDASGYSYYLGSDNGIVHSYVDKDVENGKRYFYALAAYDRGDEIVGIFPSENSFSVQIISSGEIEHSTNAAVAIPDAPAAGFIPPPDAVPLNAIRRYGTGEVFYKVLNPKVLKQHTYRVEFLDTQVDSIDNNGNGLMDAADSTEWMRLASSYSVRDMNDIIEQFVSLDTAVTQLSHQNLIGSTVVVRDVSNTVVPSNNYKLDLSRGAIRSSSPGSLPVGNYTIIYQYYPVYKSQNVQGTPFKKDSKDSDIFDGIELYFNNRWYVDTIRSQTYWAGGRGHAISISPLETQSCVIGSKDTVRGYKKPSDYAIIFSNSYVDTTTDAPLLLCDVPRMPVKFRVFNRTDSNYIKFVLSSDPSHLTQDEIVFLEQSPRGEYVYTWDLILDIRDTLDKFGSGDTLYITMTKSFRQGDILQFTPIPEHVDHELAKNQLSRVRVVPNPYVVSSTHESPLPPGITSGRGIRKIEFIHLPAGANIKIFTARGELVRELRHDGNLDDGSVAWDMKTSENLDIAFGIYFYVVESSVGTKTGKIAIIK